MVASDLPRAGTRREVLGKTVWRVTHQISDFCTSVERLAWAKASGCPWDARICSVAARSGRLEVLQWAREHHCPWDEGTCYCAALNGHLEVLRWAREQGCPWGRSMCVAASHNHPQTLAWVRAQP